MNILNITTITGLRGGDIQMHTVYQLLKSYPDLNQFILCPEDSDLYKMNGKIDSHFIPYNKKNKIFSAIQPIIKTVKEKKIDIVHIHDSSALSAVLLAALFFPANVKIILSRKRDKPIKKNFLGKIKYGNKKIVKIVCVSNAVAAIFKFVVKDQSKITTIYDGIDVQKFTKNQSKNLIHQALGLSNDTKIVGNVAALEKQKDILTFVAAAAYVKEKGTFPNVKFVVIGEGKERAKIEAYIQERKLENDVFLLGFKKNVHELLPEFNVFMMSSISEGLPLTIYEAFACQIPVISTKAGGVPEAVIDRFSGLTSEIKDFESLGEKLIEILTNESLKQTMVKNAFQLVQEKFDLPVLRENYYQLYKTL
ncbi:MAG TPA: glycosyltransferase family 4 protein [Moheibacter sp.]|nr:glycosyltransferase family 4 protein [Moheibacter sp.]